MRLLLLEDDTMIGKALRQGLQHEGHSVDWLQDGALAEHAVDTTQYDLVILDLGLPGKDGIRVLTDLRRRENPLPVIITTARDQLDDRVRGLDLGADDYLVKPFDLDELLARIRAVARRHHGRAHDLLQQGPVELNPATHEVRLEGKPVALSAREFALLLTLMERPKATVSRTQLEERLYGWDEEIASNAVEVHIHHLRKKLGERFIHTIRGLGYTLDPGVR
ncbi:MAG: response regulator [Gammaproteobacteria bacterium]|nr:response regulator [Gammaproteobacteria bacterium]